MAKVLAATLSEPLNGAKTAKVDINTGTGNLTVGQLVRGDPVLVSGTLEYLEKQDRPTVILNSSKDHATVTIKGGRIGQPWFHLPWEGCMGATTWQVHLNPTISSDITARSGGGNVRLDLAGMSVTRLMADTGGGNMDVVLPDHAANLGVIAKTGGGNVTIDVGSGITGSNTLDAHSGAGNVVVRLPSGLAAKIRAASGMGKVIVSPAYEKLDKKAYQSPDYDGAVNRIEISVDSGAGNVSVSTK